ncbi:MAG: heme exporter protein D [Candidatus Azotimanducaceae bacterium]|jgi:heme exporter protein D
MQFESLNEFIQMGGHGPFVFSVYIISILVLVGNVVRPLWQKKRFYLEQANRQERDQS